jgi:Zn-dependent peptidase ImmA (M78 family)
MNKISVEDALLFAEEHFPNAPERLVDYLEIEVKNSPLNCDGWCLQFEDRAVIRINSVMSDVRKRFTLAHELGHLIYEVPTVVGESVLTFGKRSKEERLIDKFAAELLLPASIVLNAIQEIPVTAKALQRLAKNAKVSDLAVALRVANLTTEIGLNDASVVFYENDTLKWQWSETLKLTGDTPAEILAECTKLTPNPARILHKQNEVIVASFIENPNFNTKVLFLQLVSEFDGFKQLREEKIRELEENVFAGEVNYKRSFEGCIGWIKPRIENLPLDEAVAIFNNRYLRSSERWGRTQFNRLRSKQGSEYIRLRLQIWTKN